jgi:hypothetical protein
VNKRNIAKHLQYKIKDWLKHIDDDKVKKTIEKNVIITGGSIVSLLNGELPNDYDVYFKTFESCLEVTKYFAEKWNTAHPEKHRVDIKVEGEAPDARITAFIKSAGVVTEDDESPIDDPTEQTDLDVEITEEVTEEQQEAKPKYRPRYFSSNAISLSDKIQLVIRFYGPVEEIHKNYDFVHCTCSYDYANNEVNLPNEALECILNKELRYNGSKYPLCSIIRTRKFISRGYTINAGQYLKMCLQLNELDLKDFRVFRDQITGVDSYYFEQVINNIIEKQEEDPSFTVDNSYLFEVINKIFG